MSARYILIEDATFIREMIKANLEHKGHICVGEAESGKEALDLVLKTLPEFIILDMVLPDKNGLTIAKEIKDHWPEGKIIGCSTLSQEELNLQAKEREYFFKFIKKPFNKAELLSALDKGSL